MGGLGGVEGPGGASVSSFESMGAAVDGLAGPWEVVAVLEPTLGSSFTSNSMCCSSGIGIVPFERHQRSVRLTGTVRSSSILLESDSPVAAPRNALFLPCILVLL